MTLDLISRAEARIAEIKQQRLALDYEEFEIETALKVLHRFLGESTTQIPSNSGPDEANSADLSTTSVPAQEPQPSAPAPAAQMQPLDEALSPLVEEGPSSSAGTEGIEDRQPIQPETAEPISLSTEGVNEPQMMVAAGANTGGDDEVAQPNDEDIEKKGCRPVEGGLGASSEAPGSAVESGASSISPSPVTLTPTIAATPSKRAIFERCIAEHPDWPAKLIAEHTGLPLGTIRGYASMLGVKLPSQAEYNTTRTEAAKEPQEARKPVLAPEATPAIQTPPPSKSAAPRYVQTKPMTVPKSGTMFRLRHRVSGDFLHQDILAMEGKGTLIFVEDKRHAWQGTEQQLRNVYKRLPATVDLREEVVQP